MNLLNSLKSVGRSFLWTPSQVGFGPGEPIRPAAPGEPVRRFDYTPSRNVMWTPRAAEQRAVSYEQMRNLADSYGVLRTVIEKRKDEFVGLEWKIEVRPEYAESGLYEDEARDEQKFWERPDREHTFDSWIRTLLEDDFVIDASCLYMNRDRAGRVSSLDIVDGSTILVLIDDKGRVPVPPDAAYEQVVHGQPRTGFIRPMSDNPWMIAGKSGNFTAIDGSEYFTEFGELLYSPYCLRSSGVYGFSHVESIILTVNIALRRDVSMLEWFRSGNVPAALVQIKDMTPDQIQEWQTAFDNLLSGDLAARSKVHAVPGEGGITQFAGLTMDAVLDEWLARITCARFGVSPAPYCRSMNRAEAQTVEDAATEESLVPLMQHKKKLFDLVISEAHHRPYLQWVWTSQGKHYRKEDAQINDMMLKAGAITIDQMCRFKGLPALPDGLGKEYMVWTGGGPVLLKDIISGKYKPSSGGLDTGGSPMPDNPFELSIGPMSGREGINEIPASEQSPFELEMRANKAADVNLSAKLILKDKAGRVLLLKDARSPYWDLPGGHIQDGETPEAGLIREVEEETGQRITGTKLKRLGARQMKLGDSDRVVLFYEMTVDTAQDVSLSDEHTAAEWVEPDKLSGYNLGAFRPVLNPGDTGKAISAELAAWERFAIARLGKKQARTFVTKTLLPVQVEYITGGLKSASTPAQVKAVFDTARQTSSRKPRLPSARPTLDSLMAEYEGVLLDTLKSAKDATRDNGV